MPDVRFNFPKRILRAIEVWNKLMSPLLVHRARMLKTWASNYYDEKDGIPHTMNLIDRGIGIVVPYLAMSNPKVMVKTKIPQLKPWAYTTELALNHHIQETDFSINTLRPAILNSMFGAGIVKTGIMHSAQSEYMGYLHDIGQVYSDVIDDSDYIGDPSATNRESMEIEGHRYRLPTEYAKEFFGNKHADKISADYKLYGDKLPQGISKNILASEYHTLREYSEFYDIWLPDEDIIITLRRGYSKILRTVEWEGPERGPFDFLGYKFFPQTVMPIPPVWGWLDMDSAINVVINKMRTQAENAKKVLAYSSSAAEDAERVASTPDRGTVRVDDINAMQEIEYGGINPTSYQWVDYIENQYSIQGGNLYTLGGRNVQAGTLGQEQMLQSNASRILDDMVNQVYNFAKKIFKKRAWFLWTDPLINIPEIKRVPGVANIEVVFDQADKEGDFYDFNFDIEPYSMQRFNPNVTYQKMLSFISQWILPVSQMAAQQGSQLDINMATRELAKNLQLSGIDEWWKSAVPVDVQMNPYTPQQGKIKASGVSDGQTGLQGSASRDANLRQQQSRAYQKSSSEK